MTITATYHAPAGDAEVTTNHGVRFFDGQPVELDATDHRRLIGKLRHNQHFELTGAEDLPEDVPTAGQAFTAKHKGRGVYAIMRGRESVVEGLSKPDAEAFNALSDIDKAEYVQVSLEEAGPVV